MRTTCKQNIVILHISSDQDDGLQTSIFFFYLKIIHSVGDGGGGGSR